MNVSDLDELIEIITGDQTATCEQVCYAMIPKTEYYAFASSERYLNDSELKSLVNGLLALLNGDDHARILFESDRMITSKQIDAYYFLEAFSEDFVDNTLAAKPEYSSLNLSCSLVAIVLRMKYCREGEAIFAADVVIEFIKRLAAVMDQNTLVHFLELFVKSAVKLR